jgi:hypothetical protein
MSFTDDAQPGTICGADDGHRFFKKVNDTYGHATGDAVATHRQPNQTSLRKLILLAGSGVKNFDYSAQDKSGKCDQHCRKIRLRM